MVNRSVSRSCIRRERLIKAVIPAVLLLGYLLYLFQYTAGLGAPYPSLLWLQWGIAVLVLLCLSIWCVRMADPRRTSFAKSIQRFCGQRDLEELMEEIDEDLSEPVYCGAGIRIGKRWVTAGFYFPKAVSLEHTAGVFLIESKDKAHNFYIRFLDDSRGAATFLIGFEATARKAYDYLLTLCPWLIHGSQEDYTALMSLPEVDLEARMEQAKQERYRFCYLDPNSQEFSNAALSRLWGTKPSGPRLVFPLSSTLMLGFAQSAGIKKRTAFNRVFSAAISAAELLLACVFAFGCVTLAVEAVRVGNPGMGMVSVLLAVLAYLLLHMALGIWYAAFGKREGQDGVSGEIAKIEQTIFCGGKEPVPPREELWLLGFAAPVRAKNMEWCDRFESGYQDDANQLRQNLRESWGISGAASLRSTLGALFRGLHAPVFDPYLPALSMSPGEREAFFSRCGLSGQQAKSLCLVFQTLIGQFTEYGLRLPRKTVFAWDLCRAADLAVLGLRLGYLQREEALDAMRAAGELANLYYRDWNSFASAYVFGRRLWQFQNLGPGEASGNSDVKYVAVLAGSPKSFYQDIPFSAFTGRIGLDRFPHYQC